VKSPSRAKERLRHFLSQEQRAQLARAMFEDVLVEALKVRGLDRLVVVSNDAQILVVAAAAGAFVLIEGDQQSHSASADWAARECMKRGAETVLLIPIDVPLVRADELDSLVDESKKLPRPHLVIVPSQDGTGTNAMVRTPPDVIRSNFGPDSFSAHVARAQTAGAAVKVMRPPGLLHDLDEPSDLSLFLDLNPNGRTANLLREFRTRKASGAL
jgi:2-phospho-L-lactate/phosphoenolpyruvate guanylyltransferase